MVEIRKTKIMENIVITLEKIEEINTPDVLYNTRLKRLEVYPRDVDINTIDFDYIRKNCFRLKVIDNN
jgi:hypothetical protein